MAIDVCALIEQIGDDIVVSAGRSVNQWCPAARIELGARKKGLPGYVAVPYASSIGLNPGYFGGHMLGAQHNPFMPGGNPNSPGYQVKSLSLDTGLTLERLEDRTLPAVCYALYGAVPGARQSGQGLTLRSDHAATATRTEVSLELTVAGRRLEITRRTSSRALSPGQVVTMPRGAAPTRGRSRPGGAGDDQAGGTASASSAWPQ